MSIFKKTIEQMTKSWLAKGNSPVINWAFVGAGYFLLYSQDDLVTGGERKHLESELDKLLNDDDLDYMASWWCNKANTSIIATRLAIQRLTEQLTIADREAVLAFGIDYLDESGAGVTREDRVALTELACTFDLNLRDFGVDNV